MKEAQKVDRLSPSNINQKHQIFDDKRVKRKKTRQNVKEEALKDFE